MKRYQTAYIALAMTALAIATPAEAQQLAGGQVNITNKQVKKQGNEVKVNMDLNLDKLNLKSNEGLVLIPMIVNGNDTLKMPATEILGRKRYIYYQRNGQTATANPLKVVKRQKNEAQTINYAYSAPYSQWMQGSQLVIGQDVCGCNQAIVEEGMLSQAGDAILGPWKMQFAYVQPQPEAVKARQENGTARLKFNINKALIVANLGNNNAELNKIRQTIDMVKNDKDVTITSILLHGYASPDGSYANNEKLAQNRTEALRNYLKGIYPVADNLFKVSSTAEDWEGVKKYIANNEIPQKETVLNIINSNMTPDEMEKAIANKAGEAHKYLIQNVYPDLRRTEYTVNYDVRSFNLEEAREVLKTRPQKLSLNEMYIVANSYKKGSEEFNNVFDTAVKMFPNDKLANLNAAYVALNRGDKVSAEKYLQKAGTSAEAENARGALAAMKQDYNTAKTHFEKAANAGLAEAQANLAELNKRM